MVFVGHLFFGIFFGFLCVISRFQKKYPNWQEVYFAKAIGFCALNQTDAMVKALKVSCSLGNKEACGDADGFSGTGSPLAP